MGQALVVKIVCLKHFYHFFDSENYEDTIRNAISIGGDSDTVAAIAGCIAGTYYGIPKKFIKKANTFFIEKYDYDLIEIINQFENKYPTKIDNKILKFFHKN